nr:unnamed protein product [Digitaria exilis]
MDPSGLRRPCRLKWVSRLIGLDRMEWRHASVRDFFGRWMEGWLKVNVDGAFSEETGEGGIGVIVRDCLGANAATAEEGEVLACKEGMRLVVEWGQQSTILETESRSGPLSTLLRPIIELQLRPLPLLKTQTDRDPSLPARKTVDGRLDRRLLLAAAPHILPLLAAAPHILLAAAAWSRSLPASSGNFPPSSRSRIRSLRGGRAADPVQSADSSVLTPHCPLLHGVEFSPCAGKGV